MHKSIRNTVLKLTLCLLLAACSQSSIEQATISPIEAVANDYLGQMLQRYPATATYYSLPGARHDKLFDNSPEARLAWQAKEDAWLSQLTAIGRPGEIGSRDWVTYGILYEELAGSVATRICRSELWAASSATAWHTDLPFVFDLQPLGNPLAREEALQRLSKVASYIDVEISNLRTGRDFGYSAPRPTVMAVPGEIRALLNDDNPFLNVATRDDDAEFKAAVRQVYDQQIAPAIRRFADYIEQDYLPMAREDLALTANPGGEQCYVALVRAFTTISPSPDAIHTTGLEQVALIRADMQAVVDEHFGGGALESFLQRLNADPEFTFRSEAEILDRANTTLAGIRALMPDLFSLLPKADVVVKPYPDYRESATGEYWSSSEDGTRPGIMYLPTGNPEQRSRTGQQSFLYHETLPGHHLQSAIALELGDRVHPIARYLWSSGFGEGWALYSERLMDELDQYTTPLDRIGMLSDQGARAARLVIDTGLHTRGWSRQKAVDYMLANTAWPPSDVESEINRYIAWPGQANAYMLGMLEIVKSRRLAEQAFGDDFDVREFHARVLENGNITLPMLEEIILDWIQQHLEAKAIDAK